jgi:PEP-CTERM motif
LVYVVNGSQQFGTINVAIGAFQQIGPAQPEAGSFGLAAAPNGSLVTFAYSSNLYSIKPTTGSPTLVGPTGLADCATPTLPCGPTSSATLGNFAGKIYATDFQNNLYDVNSVRGAATLIGPTGIPAIPFVPGSINDDGTINSYDEAIFGSAGDLYEMFDAFTFDLNSFTVVNTIVAPALYQLDPSSGLGTLVGTTNLGIGAVVGVDGTYYAFNDMTGQIEGFNLANGNTNFISNFDPAAGVIQGAVPVPTPEPSSLALFGTGLLGLGAFARSKLTHLHVDREKRLVLPLK